MRPLNRILLVAIATILLLGVGTVSARSFKAPSDDVSAGAQLYDRVVRRHRCQRAGWQHAAVGNADH